ncbi:polysaccharide deacetylase family protein [Solitalea lacus]|uniref:polysaccharide deacetylase family protein n=1 Tax=Solitalea lacus TaxID=2911172 RepID=UPI001EDAB39F|nr:polysaccharide deacetylase family protein [Solitalea lacus]UKJ07249.1 polysaccharide deacetylase family protein [Solitalea lacus]
MQDANIKASFFFTGRFYRNPKLKSLVKRLRRQGNYLGSHSDEHLLYCDWMKRDSLLINYKKFVDDLTNSYVAMAHFGISKDDAKFFLPPYEWYNTSIVHWTKEEGLQLINFTPGTRSTADYTWPEMGKQYLSSDEIYKSIQKKAASENGLNGFILLIHIGTDQRRTDKFYHYLPGLINELVKSGYKFVRIDELL